MFCTICGTEKVAVPTGCFDGDTGKPTTYLVCPNVNRCRAACQSNGGHRFGFLSSTCERCRLHVGWGLGWED